ncbi:MAG: metal ABC transporter substrate-binding protein [Pseudomonadota bacterium]
MAVTAYRFLLALILTVCALSMAHAQDRPRVVAVNYPLSYFAERLLADEAEIIFPVPADVDPSFWRPTIADISMIQSADLILLNGAGFAAWVDRVSLPRAKLVNTSSALEDRFIVTETITHSHGEGGEHSHEGLASYTWLDPTLAIAQAKAIAAGLTARGIGDANAVETRLATLRADLEALDVKTSAALATLTEIGIVATHPRYQYFARRYGLSISALDWEAGAMPDAAQLAALSALAAQTNAQILIWEAEPPAEAIARVEELGLKSVVFAPLAQPSPEGAYLEALDAAISALSGAAMQNRGG